MDLQGIVIAVVCVGGMGLLIGVFLSYFGKYFHVESDPREEAILEALPGNNCGGCGFAGCSGLASAIVRGDAPVSGCPVGGEKVGKQVGEIMGVEAEKAKRKRAHVKCKGTCEKTRVNYLYHGVEDCRMLSFVPGGGAKTCEYGCLGFGSCKKVCQFDAIDILDGIAVINKEKCKSCGKCVSICPKDLIEMIPYEDSYAVECSSKEKGPVTAKACKAGCIACGICEKECPDGAITVTDFVAYIDQEKCTDCGICAAKCPKKVIKVI